jgi:hypothetical protein
MRTEQFRARRVGLLALISVLFAAHALAQSPPPTDPALARLIERLTDRRSDDLIPERRPDGSLAVDLKGRFQQAPLARFTDDDLALAASRRPTCFSAAICAAARRCHRQPLRSTKPWSKRRGGMA